MEIRKEQIVFGATALVLGYLLYGSLSARTIKVATTTRAERPVLVHHPAPDPELVLPRAWSDGAQSRELFAPPSDTRRLPPLAFVAPPLVPLAVLRPPPEPGPAPKLYGKFLRTQLAPFEAPGLFANADAEPADVAAPAAPPKTELSPQERADRVASNKKLYDWVRTVEVKFGQIHNPDRYTLARRPNEDVLFVEFNPATGKPRLPGQAPIPLKRSNVNEFGFADTVANQIELERAQFGDPLAAAEYEPALAFAAACIERRLEAPRALEIAAEMYARAATIAREDPAPRLGLARCAEAAFDFEKAFEIYRELSTSGGARSPQVLAPLAVLESRFRLFDRAEAHFAEAERYGRTLWSVQGPFGHYLLERGRGGEAVAHLRLATQNEPSGPEHKRTRARLRFDLGAALLASGEATEAGEWFEKAAQADPADSLAPAGALAAAIVRDPKPSGSSEGLGTNAGFELLVATAIDAIAHRDASYAVRARENLLLAAAQDPLRAYIAWRTLAYLAEVSGYPEEALRAIELAYENDPTDPWTLYQRGRILAARDDLDGAAQSLSAALENELDFPEALAELGAIAHRRGDFAAGERYLERAVMLEPKLSSAQALRGVNFLEMGALHDAEECFRGVLAHDVDHPTARNGLAWCFYAKGESTEALTRFRELDDNRRSAPEDDPHRVYARAQIARISDHLEKVAWSDRFERRTLLNGWETEEKSGPQVSIGDGHVTLAGAFKQNGRARLWQVRNAAAFVSIEARLTVKSGTTARVGLFVSRETSRSGESQVEAEATVSRHNDPAKNTVQTRLMKRGEEELAYTDVQGFDWKLDQPVVVRIERTGQSSETRVRILFDGFPVLDDKPLSNLGRTNSELRMGIFAEGQTGRQVQLEIDDVEIVYREKP